ncbi:hypothetical protein C5952_00440 [Cronobacter sakazakii]|uniref:hypothetical protein n=1 Tax=Cronobacter sakazakii TaxID=28141 RepID=UPI000CFCF79B|nr:hypothetical protein [Cronobacter sakazakii]HDC4441794.1 hypothetical protein [Enterobacter cloacae]ELY6361629.1 hypothetical protein [Cronobacter sakazakii]ELY6363981.1 hypothetical protein [Cronobacter sakazakii]PQX69278.1 hypothetical protein C5952_00440 [Cronobacter sakazakii]PQY05156.1 hypothetical protein C5936_13470 [Cronobacter sakazakii]
MNKPKSQRLDLTTMTGEQIADLILNGKYTKSALWAFISRNGGADAVHARFPQIAVCLHILKQERKKAKHARAVKSVLKPLSNQRAAGMELTEILRPILEGHRQLYLDKLGLSMTHEQIIMLLVAVHGTEALESYGYPIIGDFPVTTEA